jgi:GLPGLI family protein
MSTLFNHRSVYRTFIMFVVFLLAGMHASQAQHSVFLAEGRIEFERKFNIYSVIDPAASWAKDYRLTHDQFRSFRFSLDFNNQKTAYYPNPDQIDESVRDGLTGLPAQTNVIFSDLKNAISFTNKKIYEKKYLITDSIRTIRWKLTNEKRNIAGFECKRANGIIMDSIYVVGFYSEEIVTPGGPESFSGLPGMILGLAIPSLHVTWFATKIYPLNNSSPDALKPQSGTKLTNAGLKKELGDVFAGKGRFAWMYYANALL